MLERMVRRARVGFGAMHLSTAERPARADAIDTVHAALDAGVRLIDTADAYCRHASDTGHNELLVAEALRSWNGPRHEVVVATKGGHVRDARGGWHVNGDPAHLTRAAIASRERLGVDRIELYQFHRPDPDVPFGRSIASLAELLDAGVIASAGVSNVDTAQADVASKMLPLASVQDELSPVAPDSLPVVAWCHRHGVPFLAWGPFGGRERAASPAGAAFEDVAASLGLSVHRTVLAWLLSLAPEVVPIPGSSRRVTVEANASAVADDLDAAACDALDRAVARDATPAVRDALEELRSRERRAIGSHPVHPVSELG